MFAISTWDRNCNVEQTEPLDGCITGNIPPWLRGSVISNGPGLMKYGDQEFKHVFDGSAILQKMCFTETGVTYTSKFLRSDAYKTNSEHGQIVMSEFGTRGKTVTKGVLSKFGEKFQFDKLFSDNCPVNLVLFGGSYYANTEAPFLHRVNMDTLDTIEKVDLHKLLGANTQCPHPVLLKDGSSINVLNVIGPLGPKYDIVKFPAAPAPGKESVFESLVKIASCDTRWKLNPCHMHSFGVCEGYVVLPEQPLTVDVTTLMANTIREKPLIEGMEWLNNKQVKLRVLSLKTGKELKLRLKCDPYFYMHIVNCYEDSNHIVIDTVTFKDSSLMSNFLLETLRAKGESLANEMDEGCVCRLVIPLQPNEKAAPQENLVTLPHVTATARWQKNGSIFLTSQVLCTPACEIPTLNPGNHQLPYTYFYGVSGDMKHNYGPVLKVNVRNGEVKQWQAEDTYAGTTVFVPRPGAQEEDDGVLLVNSVHKERRMVILVVLDAATMSQLASVAFMLQSDAPRPLHALFIRA